MSKNFGRSIALSEQWRLRSMTGRVRSQGGVLGIMDRTTSLFLKPICFISRDLRTTRGGSWVGKAVMQSYKLFSFLLRICSGLVIHSCHCESMWTGCGCRCICSRSSEVTCTSSTSQISSTQSSLLMTPSSFLDPPQVLLTYCFYFTYYLVKLRMIK